MLFRNMRYTLRTRLFLVILLIASLVVIDGVVFTASGTIASQMQFFSKHSICRYIAYPYEFTCSKDVNVPVLDGVTFQTYLISTADERSGVVAVGVCSETLWASDDVCDFYTGDESTYLKLPSKTGVAYMNSLFYNLYENIEPWIESVSVMDRSFQVVGMADFYLSDEGLGLVYSVSNNHEISVNAPVLMDSFGNEVEYPDFVGTILISGKDFCAMNLPVAYVEIAFQNPPSREAYASLREAFPEDRFYLDDYKTASGYFNLSYVDLLTCLTAVALAVALAMGIVRYMLDASRQVWRCLYLIGCTRKRLWIDMMFQMCAFCLMAAAISAPLSWILIQKLAVVGISIQISLLQMLFLALLGCAAEMLAIGRTCWRSVRAYAREEGSYVQEH